ncbi:MAG: DUF2231 domain-containing protein [Rhizobiaceae bacterium]|nr:DUF2231 domain-containing protein [Rhizobiaceae bacterium]MCV0406963.1 DUF2231 domain-containing protein [Rhizobiaceae bacterium]
MAELRHRYTELINRRPLHSVLFQFPVVCFTLTLITDILYVRTFHLMWHNFSAWLLFAGLVVGALAVIAAIIEALVPSLRPTAPDWPRAIGGAVVLLLGILNSFVHAGDGWTGIMPWGLTLSAVTVLMLIVIDAYRRVHAVRHVNEGIYHVR